MFIQKMLNIIKLSKNAGYQTRTLTTSRVLNRKESFERSDILSTRDTQKEQKKAEREKNLIEESRNPIFLILNTEIEATPWGIKKYLKKKADNLKKLQQSFVQQRVDILGKNLAIAHFVIYNGGKVKFRGSDKWVQINDDQKTVDIPNQFDPNYILTAIDVSGVELYYEALENFQNVPKVTHINFARSLYFDDWFMDKLTGMFPNLEYLDVSNCPRLSERGLEALYKNAKLKTLIVTNNYNSVSFELTCCMLEDIFPELKIEILKPKEEIKPLINTNLST